MKFNKIITIFIVTLIIIFSINSIITFAASAECNEAKFVVELQFDGSAIITESWEFTSSGEITRFYRDINIPDDSTISDITAKDGFGNDFIKLDSLDILRPSGYFAYENQGNNVHVEFYTKLINSSKTFVLSYKLSNLVIKHNDIAEFYHMFLNTNMEYGTIDVVQAVVIIPTGAQKSDLRIWAHSPVKGVSAIDTETKFSYYSENVPSNEYTELRILMPLSLFPDSTRLSGENRFNAIVAEEANLAENTSYSNNNNDSDWFSNFLGNILGIDSATVEVIKSIFIIAIPFTFFALTAFLSKKNNGRSLSNNIKRFYKPINNPQYFRELPSDVSPAEAAQLLRFIGKLKTSTSSQYSATLLDLNVKGYINVDSIKKDIIITFNENVDPNSMLTHERSLWNILQDASKGNNRLTVKELTRYIKSHASTVQSLLRNFDNHVNEYLSDKNYFIYENHSRINEKVFQNKEKSDIKKLNITLTAIGTIFLIAGMFLGYGIISLVGIIVFIIILVLYSSRKDKKYLAQKGEDEAALWAAFVRFLEDFTMFEDREIPEIKIWEKYLVYATAAGVSKKVLKKIPILYPDIDQTQLNQGTFLYIMMSDINRSSNLFGSSTENLIGALSVFENATQAAVNFNSASSGGGGFGGTSSFGGGGGFSGGGGGGID
ncbi:MAG: hypothetical protein A2Y17_12930 [Clostridiales bacterium GWF2_38_85]|nr:MAG: hypothetical protein A2Y17_12930 [Clostridiales bacterium GWF2_38_85]HBL84163.1 hypothetical protein [Clostridiales bacterium]